MYSLYNITVDIRGGDRSTALDGLILFVKSCKRII